MTRFDELSATLRCPAVLPDKRAVQRLAGHLVPDHNGLSLIGDADRRDRLIDSSEHVRQRCLNRVPNLVCVVLNPAGLWEVLRELSIRRRDYRRRLVEGDRTNPSSASID